MADLDTLRHRGPQGTLEVVDEEMGISRNEVTQIFEALFDIRSGVSRILGYIEEADGEEEEEDLPDA